MAVCDRRRVLHKKPRNRETVIAAGVSPWSEMLVKSQPQRGDTAANPFVPPRWGSYCTKTESPRAYARGYYCFAATRLRNCDIVGGHRPPLQQTRYNSGVSDPNTGQKFEKLVELMTTLRGPNGCPWDKQQDFNSLKPMLVEEVYEVLEAIEKNDFDGLSEELGDILLHVVFHAQLGKEFGQFNIDTVLDKISEKLVRRHPHVFGDETASSPEEVIKNWEAIKAREKAAKLKGRTPEQRSLLEGIPVKLPALHEAHQISSRVARVGFDWPDVERVFEKLQEEVLELREVIYEGNDESRRERLEDEIGDMLFCIVNIARHVKIDSESALKRTNRKFKARFQYMENELAKQGKTVDQVTLAEMEALWEKAKAESISQ